MPVSLPLLPGVPNYQFGTTLGDRAYIFDMRWNARAEAWYFDLSLDDGEVIAHGIKVVLGAILGRQIPDVRSPSGMLIAVDTTKTGREATLDDLGERVQIWFYDLTEL